MTHQHFANGNFFISHVWHIYAFDPFPIRRGSSASISSASYFHKALDLCLTITFLLSPTSASSCHIYYFSLPESHLLGHDVNIYQCRLWFHGATQINLKDPCSQKEIFMTLDFNYIFLKKYEKKHKSKKLDPKWLNNIPQWIQIRVIYYPCIYPGWYPVCVIETPQVPCRNKGARSLHSSCLDNMVLISRS